MARRIRGREPGFQAALVLFLALLAGCGERRPPDVVIVTIDTLRADRLGCYGSRSTRTPILDAFASQALLFENAATTMPETLPAHASLFTGRYPRQHGVLSNAMRLGDDAVTLAERFAAAGYDRAAFVGARLLGAPSGIPQGFETFDGPDEALTRPAGQVVAAARAWLETVDPRRPVFLWVHFFDPHMPYEPPADLVRADDSGAAARSGRFTWRRVMMAADGNGGDLPLAILGEGMRLYDAEVEATDRELGALFETLRRAGLYDEALIAVTADHGECFDHGIYFEHGRCLYDGATRIPLLLRGGRRQQTRVGRRMEQVSIVDLAPTLLAAADLPAGEMLPGRDLLGVSAGSRPAFAQHPLYSEADVGLRRDRTLRLRSVAGVPTRPVVGDREIVAVRTPEWKLLVDRDSEELYHLETDPAEEENRAAAEPERTGELRDQARRWLHEHPLRLPPSAPISDELRRELEALGYL